MTVWTAVCYTPHYVWLCTCGFDIQYNSGAMWFTIASEYGSVVWCGVVCNWFTVASEYGVVWCGVVRFGM